MDKITILKKETLSLKIIHNASGGGNTTVKVIPKEGGNISGMKEHYLSYS